MTTFLNSAGRIAYADEAVMPNGTLRPGFSIRRPVTAKDGELISFNLAFMDAAKKGDEPKTADDFIRAAFYRKAGTEKPEEVKAWLEGTAQRDIEKIASEAAAEWASVQAGKGLGMQFDSDNERDRMIADMKTAGRQPQGAEEIHDHANSHRHDATDSAVTDADVNAARAAMIADMVAASN